jgi:hypothetical protein
MNETRIEVASILSARTHEGMVEFQISDGERTIRTQWDLPKAREIVSMIQGATEAAISDQVLFVFLTTRVNLSASAAAAALLDFREIRQGSRSTVYPT